jgi:Kef-type K+ transport system membrane component KefB
MHTDLTPLFVGAIIFISSLISLRLGFSVAIIEILFGSIAGNLGLGSQEWMKYLAAFGGIILTFLAGSEVDIKSLRENLKESLFIGGFSFLVPFIFGTVISLVVLHWNIRASLITGIALSSTSLAVVYSVLVEQGLSQSRIGKLLMSSTFITNMGTAIALSFIFVKLNLFTLLFFGVSIFIIVLASLFSHHLFGHSVFRNRVVESEIKYIFLLLLVLIFFGALGKSHAVLPAFVLGLCMSRYFVKDSQHHLVMIRLRTVAYAFITPVFFIVGGLHVSFPLILTSFGLFVLLFFLKFSAKFLGVYFLARKYIPQGTMYITLIMSTGLTFGMIASQFGLQERIISQSQYSVLIGVVVASAVVPTLIAQKWFMPADEEDLLEEE